MTTRSQTSVVDLEGKVDEQYNAMGDRIKQLNNQFAKGMEEIRALICSQSTQIPTLGVIPGAIPDSGDTGTSSHIGHRIGQQ